MMSVLLRIEMIVLALVFIVLVFRTVNKQRLQMRFSLVWLMISFAMMVVAIFPQTCHHAVRLGRRRGAV